jgi:ABC-2 type transport system permease protein
VNWQQLQAIIWLRWRLSRNQFMRGGKLNAALSVISVVVMVAAGLSAGVGGVLGGYFAGLKAPPVVLLLIWDGVVFLFLVFWLTGLMVEIQRSESIDLPKLLHLPITLGQVFVFNYAASHCSVGMVVALPAMLGMCAGLVVGVGPAMVLMVPLVLTFVFMVTAWTYCLRGWLAALMVNKRRRRTVILWVTIVFVLLCQAPNLVFNSAIFRKQVQSAEAAQRKPGRRKGASGSVPTGLVLPQPVLQGHLALPPGWIGYGAMALKERKVWPALAAATACALLGVLGLMRAYRMTIGFYQGADGRAESQPTRPQALQRRGTLLVEWHLPWLPEDTAALTLATFRSLLRAPELKMAFIMPLVMGITLLFLRFTHVRRSPSMLPESWLGFMVTGAAALATFSIAPMISNIFGLDRNGFRALVLLPTRRHHILLAKNLACAPFAALIAFVMVAATGFLVHVPWGTCMSALLQAAVAFLLFCLLGNALSILAPYRLATGTLQAKKPKPVTILAVFVTLLCLPLVMLPMVIPQMLQFVCSFFDWARWVPVNLVATLALLAAAGFLYWLLLPLEGQLLLRREQRILQEVTEEVE